MFCVCIISAYIPIHYHKHNENENKDNKICFKLKQGHNYPPGTRRYGDVESTSLTLIQRRNYVVRQVGIYLKSNKTERMSTTFLYFPLIMQIAKTPIRTEKRLFFILLRVNLAIPLMCTAYPVSIIISLNSAVLHGVVMTTADRCKQTVTIIEVHPVKPRR